MNRVVRRILALSAAGLMFTAVPATAAPSGGFNDWSCRPAAAHPRPVVTAHGLFGNGPGNFLAIGPALAAKGYCVFTPTYGQSVLPGIGGTDYVQNSAKEFGGYVDKVLAETGAAKVDVVGHSEGGIMPRYYLKNYGGAAKVNHFVALAPPNHGTTMSGIAELAKLFPGAAELLVGGLCKACLQLIRDSDFVRELNAGGETQPGVRYTVIVSTTDFLVTPISTSFLTGPDVRNIVIQDEHPGVFVGHIGLAYDSISIGYVTAALA
nr:alpha/beta fold hydrolase [Kibdelosporangium sp. MJ126-NF4]CEL19340.1 secreted lipase [Kibdelosporangium sp. MJ126-NF4]CTQ94861.1 secreted lipase [Kibdelosporangium sp. MJ126-NF4]